MGKATVVVTAIHNRTQETITIPHQQRGPISIEPGGTLEGPFIYTYDPEKEGAIPSPNQAWFIDSPHKFKWGAFVPDRRARLGVQSLEQARRPSHFLSFLQVPFPRGYRRGRPGPPPVRRHLEFFSSDPGAILAAMRVFISSAIRGFEPFRDVAAGAAAVLRHEVKRSEDFGASADTPQQACLAGVRWADVVVLLLGARYGDRQPSGISATHEEYQEAKSRCPVLAFVQRDVDREAAQQDFVDEVRSWAGGVLTGDFVSPDELHGAVTRALHELEFAQQAGPMDEGEMAERAQGLISDRYGFQGATLCVATACGPRQQILRPSELDEPSLERDLHREVLLGEHAVFNTTQGVQARVIGEALLLEQAQASLLVDSLGSIRLTQPATDAGAGLPVLIEEDVADRLARSLRLTAWILDRIDAVRRLSHVAPTVALVSAAYLGWRTRNEHAASPNTVQMPMNVGDRVVVSLTPAVRPRAALTYEVPEMVADLIALLRRAYRT